MKTVTFRRHGDLNFHEISEKEYNALSGKIMKDAKVVLQEGETTGHKHVLDGVSLDFSEVKKLPDGSWAIKVMRGGTLTHEDHKPIMLVPTYYRQIRERELDHFAESCEKKVVD